MEQKNTSLKKLTRAIVVVLLLVLLSLFFLLVGSWAGGVSARVVAKVVDAPGVMLTALADRVLPAENNAVNALSRHLEAYGVRLHLSLVVPYLLKTTYTIIRVIEHFPSPRQLRLDPE